MHNNESGPGPAPTLVFFFGLAPEKKAKESIKTGKSYLYRTTTTTTEDLPHAYIRRRKKNHTFLCWPPNRNYLIAAAPEEPTDLGSQVRERGEERAIHTLPRLLFTTLPHSILVLSPPAKTSASKKKNTKNKKDNSPL